MIQFQCTSFPLFLFPVLASLTEECLEILKYAVRKLLKFPATYLYESGLYHNKLWQKLNTEIRWILSQISDCNCDPLYQIWNSCVLQKSLTHHTQKLAYNNLYCAIKKIKLQCLPKKKKKLYLYCQTEKLRWAPRNVSSLRKGHRQKILKSTVLGHNLHQ